MRQSEVSESPARPRVRKRARGMDAEMRRVEKFFDRLQALEDEGFNLVVRLGGQGAQPMVFREAEGGMMAVLMDDEGRLWTFSEREGLVCEEA